MKLLTVAITAISLLAIAQSADATPISLGGAANYAILGVGGSVNFSDFEVYQSGTVVNGNIAMGPHSDLTHNVDALINGNFDYDLTSTLNGMTVFFDTTKGVQGTVNQINMMGIVADARNASTAAAGLAPTQTFSTLTEGQTIFGSGGLNIIRITGDVTLKTTLTLQGTATSQFVFQFTSSTPDGKDVLNLSGMTMILNGGILADNIIWDLNGLGGGLNINSGSVVYGNFLAPDRDVLGDHAIVQGRLIGGGSNNQLSVHSGSMVTTPTTVPEGGSILARLCLGLSLLITAKRKLLS